jgi:hypothetical protein
MWRVSVNFRWSVTNASNRRRCFLAIGRCQSSIALAPETLDFNLDRTYGTTTNPATSTAAPAPAEKGLFGLPGRHSPQRAASNLAGSCLRGTNIGASKPRASPPSSSAAASASMHSSRSVPSFPALPNDQPRFFPGLPISITAVCIGSTYTIGPLRAAAKASSGTGRPRGLAISLSAQGRKLPLPRSALSAPSSMMTRPREITVTGQPVICWLS